MNHLAASLFFTLALLGAAVAIHLMVQSSWTEIMLALKGEWGREVRATERPVAAPAFPARRAGAF